MKLAIQKKRLALGLLLGLTVSIAQAHEDLLNTIPPDALAFDVVHNLADVNHTIGEVAKLLNLPAIDVVQMAKDSTGIQKGIDEQGDLACVAIDADALPRLMVLVPIANFADFYAGLNIQEPASGLADVQISGAQMLIGRKGAYAAIARSNDRDALQRFLASKSDLAADKSLSEWLDGNKLSLVVTSHGIKKLASMVREYTGAAEAWRQRNPSDTPLPSLDGLKFYKELFDAAESEVDQFGVGLHVDARLTIDLMSRIHLVPAGAWSQWAANLEPAKNDLFSGVKPTPFVAAASGIVPSVVSDTLLIAAVKMVENKPILRLTSEQAEVYAGLLSRILQDVQSIRVQLGVPDAGSGLYSNSTAVITVADSKTFLDHYEQTVAAIHEFAKQLNNSAFLVVTGIRIPFGQTEALEFTLNMDYLKQATLPRGSDPQKLAQFIAGPSGQLKTYLVPVSQHSIVVAFASLDHLKAATDFYNSQQPTISQDSSVRQVAATFPAGSQYIGFVDLPGTLGLARDYAAAQPGFPAFRNLLLPRCPPIGLCTKVELSVAETHVVIVAETLQVIGDAVAKARAPAPLVPQQ